MTGVRAGGFSPPMDGLPQLDRPAVHALLDAATAQRVCVVIGAAGWGKTTAIANWARDRRAAWVWHDGDDHDVAGFLTGVVDAVRRHSHVDGSPEPDVSDLGAVLAWLCRSLSDELVLIMDDLQAVSPASPVASVIAGLCQRAPEPLHLVLSSRQEPPFSLARLSGQGWLAEIHARDLAFTPAEIAELVLVTMGDSAPELTTRLWERTGGWPAAVCGALDMMRGLDPDRCLVLLEHHLTGPGDRFHGYLAEEVLGQESDETRELMRRLAVFGPVTPKAAAAVGLGGATGLLTELSRRGLVLRGSTGAERWSLIGPLVDFVNHEPNPDRAELCAAAAAVCAARGDHAGALRHLLAAQSYSACVALLVEHGEGIANSGAVDLVLAVADLPGRYLTDPRVQRVIGQARQVRGQWAQAMECFRLAGQDADELDPALAWRLGLLKFTQGEFAETLAIVARTRFGGEDTVAEVRTLALAASAHRVTGDLDNTRAMVARTEAAADRNGTIRAHSVVHQAKAILASAEIDRRQAQAEFRAAVHSADAVADTLQSAWVRCSHALHALELGSPRQALAEAQCVRQLAEGCASLFVEAHSATICGRAQLRLGRLELAHVDLTAAVDLFGRLGSRFLAWPLSGLGDLYAVRGQLVRARAAYEEALGLAEPCGDLFGMSFALVGLARTRAADDLVAARVLAERAVGLGEALREVAAYLARGWIALLQGDRAQAARDAATAVASARSRQDGPGLAEALTLTVLSGDGTDLALLSEAVDIWQESGCRLEEAAARLVASRLDGTAPDLGARLADETLRGVGIDTQTTPAAGPLAVLRRSTPAVAIQTLGGFRVLRDGVAVPKTSWQSKKARALLKILVARRRPVPRDQLMELLWPGVDPGRSGNRLSVLLSGVRDALRTDRPDSEPLATDGDVIWLDPTHVHVDVEEFLSHAEDALDAHRRNLDDAVARLATTAAAYTGDFLEDDPYQDWAAPLAEDVRATHIALLRALIGRLSRAGDVDGVVRHTLRLLSQDPYDEPTHLNLVGTMVNAGSLGEARRHYQIYVRRMKDIGVTPRSLPARRG